jgi:hypothetical protein
MNLSRNAALLAALLVASCAVQHESPNGITIEVDAYHPEAAKVAAREHCEKFGKKAVLVHTSDPAPSPRLFYLDSRLVTFDCVAQ